MIALFGLFANSESHTLARFVIECVTFLQIGPEGMENGGAGAGAGGFGFGFGGGQEVVSIASSSCLKLFQALNNMA